MVFIIPYRRELVFILHFGIWQLFAHILNFFEKYKHGLFHITKRVIIEEAASIEQNQSHVSLSLLLVYHIMYSKLQGNRLNPCFKL